MSSSCAANLPSSYQGAIKGLVFLAILLLNFLGFFMWQSYNTSLMNSFCASLPPSATTLLIAEEAKKAGFFFIARVDTMDGWVSVLNQKSPFGRVACTIELKNGHMINKSVIIAD